MRKIRIPGITPPLHDGPLTPLTRKEFYDLADYCHQYALDLARHDQSRVSLKHCYEFNEWLTRLRTYDLLAPVLRELKPARPIARWQLMVLGVVLWFIISAMLPASLTQPTRSIALYGFLFSLVLFYFVPERLYGTTIELVEGKVLRVVETMEKLLQGDELDFTEAAFFQAKETLEAARNELRQQIDLAHRR